MQQLVALATTALSPLGTCLFQHGAMQGSEDWGKEERRERERASQDLGKERGGHNNSVRFSFSLKRSSPLWPLCPHDLIEFLFWIEFLSLHDSMDFEVDSCFEISENFSICLEFATLLSTICYVAYLFFPESS